MEQTLEQSVNQANREDERLALAKKLGLSLQEKIANRETPENKRVDAGWIYFKTRKALARHLAIKYGYLGYHRLLTIFSVGGFMDIRFLRHMWDVRNYPARLPFGALLKIQEAKNLAPYENIYILDENHAKPNADPFIVVAENSHIEYSSLGVDVPCWLVYGWKDKNDDSVTATKQG